MDHVAMLIAENLHFDVTRVADIFFHVERIVAERRARFRRGGAESIFDLVGVRYQLDAASAAAGRCLEQEGIADLFGELRRFVRILRMIGARYQRHSGGACDFARFELVAHHRNILGARADEGNFVFRRTPAPMRRARKEIRSPDEARRSRCLAPPRSGFRFSDNYRWSAPGRCKPLGWPSAPPCFRGRRPKRRQLFQSPNFGKP